MADIEVILDEATGAVLLENPELIPESVRRRLTELLGHGTPLACAVPPTLLTLSEASASELRSKTCVRISGYYHNSLIEGPGRRSVAKFQGCPLHCHGCLTSDSWDAAGGFSVPVDRLAEALLDPAYTRNGVSILGGEPFFQPEGLLALVRALRQRKCEHVLCYSGYTYDALRSRKNSAIDAVLDEVDILIDGPYVARLAASGGPWTGSGNQRVIDLRHRRTRARDHSSATTISRHGLRKASTAP